MAKVRDRGPTERACADRGRRGALRLGVDGRAAVLAAALFPLLGACWLMLAANAQATVRALPHQPLPLVELGTPAGASFYTTSPTEAEAALATHGFIKRDMHRAYLRVAPFTGSQPLYRLGQVGRSAYLVTASPSERDALVASKQFTYEGVLGYAAIAAGPGLEQLWRLSNGSEWRLALDRERQQLIAAGYHLDGPLGWVYAHYIRAGAIYFGRYDNLARNVITATESFYHRSGDWWGGVRDYSGDDPSVPTYRGAWPSTDFSDREPAIGFYDDSDPHTLERQIVQATSAGLSYFSFYWYWNNQTASEDIYNGLHSFLAARNRNMMEFGVQICAEDYGSLSIPRSQFDAAASTIASEYLTQPNYIRANDGRPIVWMCDTRGLGNGSTADVRAFTDDLRAHAGEEILLIANRELPGELAAEGIDGQYCTAEYESVGGSYKTYVEDQHAQFAAGAPIYQRCVMSNFDERPRYPALVPNLSSIRYFKDHTMALFDQAVANVNADIEASTRSSTIDDMVLVYAWNEWEEGGYVEPNVRDGCAYLDQLRAGLQLTEGGGCIADPPDPFEGSPSPPSANPPGITLAAPGPYPPVLSALRISPSRFAPISPTRARRTHTSRLKARVPLGTFVSFTLDRSAGVTLTIARPHAGLQLGRRCTVPSTRVRRALEAAVPRSLRGQGRAQAIARLLSSHSCDLPAGLLRVSAHPGRNRLQFDARVGTRALRAGGYVLLAQAIAGNTRSATLERRFQIVPPGSGA